MTPRRKQGIWMIVMAVALPVLIPGGVYIVVEHPATRGASWNEGMGGAVLFALSFWFSILVSVILMALGIVFVVRGGTPRRGFDVEIE